MIETLTPFGVGSEYSWSRSGCCAGQRAVIGKAERSDIHRLARINMCFEQILSWHSSSQGAIAQRIAPTNRNLAEYCRGHAGGTLAAHPNRRSKRRIIVGARYCGVVIELHRKGRPTLAHRAQIVHV